MRKIAILFLTLLVGLSLAQQDNLDATLLEGLAANEEFSTLVGLIDQAGLTEALSGAGPFTLFAPDNNVFEEINPDVLAQLNDNPELLTAVLQSHVVEGAYGILDLRNAPEGSIVTLNGDPLEVDLEAGGLKVNGADLVSTDVENTYANGVLNQVGDLVLSDALLGQLGLSDVEAATDDVTTAAGANFVDLDVNGDGVLTRDELDAGIYTRYDANQDGIIDQTEYDTNPGLFGGAFADYDADASGDLNQDEYRGAFDNAGVFDSLDADASGDISQEEYDANRDLLGLGAAGTAVPGAVTTDAAMTNTGAFGGYDADADGLLTRDEYNAGLYSRYDANADGVIDQAEYDTDPGLFGGAFTDYDADASGDLNEEEARGAFDNNTVFDSLDADASGDISQEEYDANPDLLDLGAAGAAVTGATAAVVGAETGGAETGGAMMGETGGAQMFDGTVVELLTNDGRFGTLLTAITDAGLLDSLQQQAPFTLFAPTDDAFAALPDAERETILGDTDMLSNLLLYHVVSGKVMANDLVGTEPGNTSANAGEVRGGQAATLEGSDITLAVETDGSVSVNNGQATVTEADLEASDGVVHVVDSVLVPESMMNQ